MNEIPNSDPGHRYLKSIALKDCSALSKDLSSSHNQILRNSLTVLWSHFVQSQHWITYPVFDLNLIKTVELLFGHLHLLSQTHSCAVSKPFKKRTK